MNQEIINQNNKKELPGFIQLFVFFVSILFLEIFFPIVLHHSLSIKTFLHILLFDSILSSGLAIITNIIGKKISKILTIIFLSLLAIIFSVQGVFYRIFKVYFSVYNLGLSDQLNSFMKETIVLILGDILIILLFFVPLIIYCILNRKIEIKKNNWIDYTIYVACLLISIPLLFINVESTKKESQGLYDLYHNINNISLNINKMGVLNSTYLDIKRYIFGFAPKAIKNISLDYKKIKKVETYNDNVLNLNFRDTGNDAINTINGYIKNETPTSQNKYTGIWKGYNLIYITAESFSEIGVSKELTPTLYKLTHTGFQFKNFYTPNILSTIGGEFQSLTGLYPDYSILSKWRDADNYFPFGLSTTFQNLGYSSNAYHNNWFAFQDRDAYLRSQGFTNYLGCYNGLEERMNCELWPESDDDMIEVTVNDYIHNDSFLAYYMTVSGHFEYDFDNNYMAYINMNSVENLDLPESAKAYVATQIELDKALERLINELEKANKLDNTVIVLMADHYPYELDEDSINALSTYYRDEIEVNHNALIMWNSKTEDLVIEKPCMSTDVIPTLYNLYGIPYDSRLYSGKDILSDSTGIAIMSDYSWVTEYGTYYATSGYFNAKKEVKDDYISKVNQYINAKINISKLMIETDYFRYLFSE